MAEPRWGRNTGWSGAGVARIAALGEHPRIQGFALAGLLIVPAEGRAAVRRAWAELGANVGAVLLTPAAWAALDGAVDTGDRLVAVLPERQRTSRPSAGQGGSGQGGEPA